MNSVQFVFLLLFSFYLPQSSNLDYQLANNYMLSTTGVLKNEIKIIESISDYLFIDSINK